MKYVLAVILAATGVIPAGDANRIFARAHALCAADGSRLWGVSLCAPIMLVDPSTNQAIANATLPGSAPEGGLFQLTLPASAVVSTAPVEYRGVRVAEIMWPLTVPDGFRADEFQDVLLMHESFHVIQPKLGFNEYGEAESITGSDYLGSQAGRIWLRGEFHALSAALSASAGARRDALRDALTMRFYRQSLYPGAAEQEREQDILEGLAEATGVDAGLPPKRRIAYALSDISFVEAQPSYVRAFPYATGPAYSELLDAVKPLWRRGMTSSSDLARTAMLAYGLNVTVPAPSQAQALIARYGGAAIQSEEAALAARRAALDAKYTRELVGGATVALPLSHFSIKFNPRDIEAFGAYGSVYHTLTVTASWGKIDVSGGDAMISKDFSVLRVAAPRDVRGSTVKGQGWTLHLADGYAILADPNKAGSYIVSLSKH